MVVIEMEFSLPDDIDDGEHNCIGFVEIYLEYPQRKRQFSEVMYCKQIFPLIPWNGQGFLL